MPGTRYTQLLVPQRHTEQAIRAEMQRARRYTGVRAIGNRRPSRRQGAQRTLNDKETSWLIQNCGGRKLGSGRRR